jgi:hypothetical protein
MKSGNKLYVGGSVFALKKLSGTAKTVNEKSAVIVGSNTAWSAELDNPETAASNLSGLWPFDELLDVFVAGYGGFQQLISNRRFSLQSATIKVHGPSHWALNTNQSGDDYLQFRVLRLPATGAGPTIEAQVLRFNFNKYGLTTNTAVLTFELIGQRVFTLVQKIDVTSGNALFDLILKPVDNDFSQYVKVSIRGENNPSDTGIYLRSIESRRSVYIPPFEV